METFPVAGKMPGQRTYAFEIESAYVEPGAIARLLKGVVGVAFVRERRLCSGQREIHAEFRYMNREFVVWEPFGDNTRYWIGPKDSSANAVGIGLVEDAFKRYRPPFRRRLIGGLMSLPLVKQLVSP